MADLHLLRLKRKEQIATAEKVMTLPDYDKQHKAITMLLEVLLPVSLFNDVGESYSVFSCLCMHHSGSRGINAKD